jgi:hypothetical protein
MDRRDMLAATVILGSGLAVLGIKYFFERSPEQLEKDMFQEFFAAKPFGMGSAEGSIYEVINKDDYGIGTSVHIGGGYFITANHVARDKALKVVNKRHRYGLFGKKSSFEVAGRDELNDIALLKAAIEPDGDAIVSLSDSVSNVGDPVSIFDIMGFRGEGYLLSFAGVDICDSGRVIEDYGKLEMEKGSGLLETSGKVINFDIDGINRRFKSHYSKENKRTQSLSTLVCFNGASGSPVFRRIGEKFLLEGIVVHALGTKNAIATPGNPNGFTSMQQTATVYANRDAIENLVRVYLGGGR